MRPARNEARHGIAERAFALAMNERKSSAARGYGSRWQKAREGYLRCHPLCVMCESLGRVSPASVVDHIDPHRGDQQKFWDSENWQALCKQCHDRHKQRIEKSGRDPGCGIDGHPVDATHHWNR